MTWSNKFIKFVTCLDEKIYNDIAQTSYTTDSLTRHLLKF